MQRLLCGQAAAADHLANTLRVEACGRTTFGRTDALDLFAARPLVLSSAPQVLVSPETIAVIDDMPDGRAVGILAELVDGVINRLWVVAATAAGATAEPAVAVARDDFLSQLRQRCQGDASDHPQLAVGAWPHVVELGGAALDALQEPAAASSSQVSVLARLQQWRAGSRALPLARASRHGAAAGAPQAGVGRRTRSGRWSARAPTAGAVRPFTPTAAGVVLTAGRP